MRGPDVTQLKQALASLDIWAGDPDTDLYDADTAWGVSALYERLGYTAHTGGEEAQASLRMAERGVRDAQFAVSQAEADWRQAKDSDEVDLAPFQLQIDTAYEMLWDAQTHAEAARIAVMPSLPSGEILYLTALPRRVDAVWVKRGDTLQGPALTVSGATLTIRGTVGHQDAQLLQDSMIAFYNVGNEEREATLLRIESPAAGSPGVDDSTDQSSSTRHSFVLSPGDLSDEEISEIRGTSVRVRIPVQSTEAEVLAVPIAALSAASDGSSRVELFLGDVGDPTRTESIPVTTGLAANGFVEISSDDSRMIAGARVVVGR